MIMFYNSIKLEFTLGSICVCVYINNINTFLKAVYTRAHTRTHTGRYEF